MYIPVVYPRTAPCPVMESNLERGSVTTLQDAKKLMDQVDASAPKEQNKPKVRQILLRIQQAASVWGVVAQLDPRAQMAATAFMGVINLELARMDNEEEIIAVCYSMTFTIPVIHNLNKHLSMAGPLAEQLEEKLKDMTTEIENFGKFALMYYTKCSSWLVRWSRASEFKATIEGYVQRFRNFQNEAQFVMIAEMSTNLSTLIDRMEKPPESSNKEQTQMIEYITKNDGGAEILKTEDGHKEFSRALKFEFMSSTIEALECRLSVLLDQISESLKAILNRLGPETHKWIQEEDVRGLWKTNGWKVIIPCRTFVEGLCTYYDPGFAEIRKDTPEGGGFIAAAVSDSDKWTLNILAEAIHSSALGEAIDADASGFISVHEFDRFLKKKADESTLIWFSFWAVGHHYLNHQYTAMISALLANLEQGCGELKSIQAPYALDKKLKSGIHRDALDRCIGAYQSNMEVVRFITDWADSDSDLTIMEIIDLERERLTNVAHRLAKKEEDIIEKELMKINYELTGPVMLLAVTHQSDFRMEQHILVLLYLILRKHEGIISKGKSKDRHVLVSEVDAMDLTLSVLESTSGTCGSHWFQELDGSHWSQYR
ncbi:hypothetical protein C8R45DRAFT_1165996 [Mycena sanguinolenta]|nr:hypothetical protein C8R45DRAFT_1165996 [Mycena sanguinolenta]